jgi:hypothetical protein
VKCQIIGQLSLRSLRHHWLLRTLVHNPIGGTRPMHVSDCRKCERKRSHSRTLQHSLATTRHMQRASKRIRALLAIATTVVTIVPTHAVAQDRGDQAEARGLFSRIAKPEAPRPPNIEAPPAPKDNNNYEIVITSVREAPPLTLNLILNSGLDTNPDETRTDSHNAGWFNPALSVNYAKSDIGSGFSTALAAGSDADLFTRAPSEDDETRINGAALLAHELAGGKLTAGMRERVAYSGAGYGRFHYAIERYVLEYAPKASNLDSFDFTAEYRASNALDQRRWFSSASVSLTPKWGGIALGFGEELDLGIFRDPSLLGRHDLLSSTTLALAPANGIHIGPAQLELDASFFHRFSNKHSSVYSEFQIGPKLSYAFGIFRHWVR